MWMTILAIFIINIFLYVFASDVFIFIARDIILDITALCSFLLYLQISQLGDELRSSP